MRDILIMLFIVIIIFSGNYLIDKYLDKTSEELVNSLQHLKEHVIIANENKDREYIMQEMEHMERSWENISNVWSIIVMHQEIDNIEQALVKSKAMINDGNIEDAIPELETAIFYVEHVNAREKLKLKNVF